MKLQIPYLLTWASVAVTTPSPSPAALAASPTPSAYLTLTNHITACPSKFKLEKELLLDFLYKVKKNEPGVLEFQLNTAAANNSFLTYEKYASAEAVQHHLNTSYYHHLINTEAREHTKCAPNQVFFLDNIFEFIRN